MGRMIVGSCIRHLRLESHDRRSAKDEPQRNCGTVRVNVAGADPQRAYAGGMTQRRDTAAGGSEWPNVRGGSDVRVLTRAVVAVEQSSYFPVTEGSIDAA
jgi:hypothetical protein